MDSVIKKINSLTGSDGKLGWPVCVKDRIAYYSKPGKNVAVTFLWTIRDDIIPKLEKENLALASNFYTPAGLEGMVRNILSNPFIRYIILLGDEEVSRDCKNCNRSDSCNGKLCTELTSANAIRTFFEKGITQDRKIPGFENAVYFDKNIPTEMIELVRKHVTLIDLNKTMPDKSLDEKIEEANRLIKTLEKKPPFMESPMVFDYEKTEKSFPYEGGPIIVSGTTIPKTWVEIMHIIYRYGKDNLMNANTDRWVKEINNLVAVIHDPQNMDLSFNPFLVPLTMEKITDYQKEVLSPELPKGKAYTYGNKLRAYIYPNPEDIRKLVSSDKFFEFNKGPHLDKNINYLENACEIDQIDDIADVLKRDPYSKACVAITWHVHEELMRKHKSSPCLVFIQALVQDEKLNLTVFFRSHDMVQGWPENAYGCAAIQKYIADKIGIDTGILTIISGSAQIYRHYYKQVENMLKKFRKWEECFSDPRGNFVIKVENGNIVVMLTDPNTSRELERFEGKTAKEVYTKIAFSVSGLRFDHAMYLGSELGKAETALKNNCEYEQDKPLIINP